MDSLGDTTLWILVDTSANKSLRAPYDAHIHVSEPCEGDADLVSSRGVRTPYDDAALSVALATSQLTHADA